MPFGRIVPAWPSTVNLFLAKPLELSRDEFEKLV